VSTERALENDESLRESFPSATSFQLSEGTSRDSGGLVHENCDKNHVISAKDDSVTKIIREQIASDTKRMCTSRSYVSR